MRLHLAYGKTRRLGHLMAVAGGMMMLSVIALAQEKPDSMDDTGATEPLTKPTLGQVDPATPSVAPYQRPSKAALRRRLTPAQYDVTQNEATEPPRQNSYWNSKAKGTYECVVCGQDLFTSRSKFDSGTGWPSYFKPITAKNVETKTDYKIGYARTEVHCSRCQGHLGHVFNDGPAPTGKRYCINSASLNFVEQSMADGSETAKELTSK